MVYYFTVLLRPIHRSLPVIKRTKFGILFTVFFLLGTYYTELYTQDCIYTGEIDIQYYKVNMEDHRELLEGLFLDLECQNWERKDSIFLHADPGDPDLHWEDPDASTPQGILFFLFRDIPESDNPTPEEFLELVVLSDIGHPIAFEPNTNIWISKLLESRRPYYLLPALVNHTGGGTPEELFEGACISLLLDNRIKVIRPTGHIDYAEEEGVGLIRSPQWPQEVPITHIIDLIVRDEFRTPVSLPLYHNRTLRLHLTRKNGFYDSDLKFNNGNCLFATNGNYPYP